MPMTSPEDIKGEHCDQCGKWASHFYGNIPLCCQCHGGGIWTEKETRNWQEDSILPDERKEE